MKTYFLFSDDEVFHRELDAQSWRQAIAQARDWFGIKGRLVIKTEYQNARDYHLVGTDYTFTLRKVN